MVLFAHSALFYSGVVDFSEGGLEDFLSCRIAKLNFDLLGVNICFHFFYAFNIRKFHSDGVGAVMASPRGCSLPFSTEAARRRVSFSLMAGL